MLFLGSVHLLKLLWAACQGLLTRPLLSFSELIQSFCLCSHFFSHFSLYCTFCMLANRSDLLSLPACLEQATISWADEKKSVVGFDFKILGHKNPLKRETKLGMHGALGWLLFFWMTQMIFGNWSYSCGSFWGSAHGGSRVSWMPMSPPGGIRRVHRGSFQSPVSYRTRYPNLLVN